MRSVLDGTARWVVEQGDCLDVLRALPDACVDAIVTDPPYELTANKKGGSGAASLNVDSPAGRSRIGTGGGFMGKAWDATGIAYSVPLWREALRVLRPGGHLLAFGGTRTYHRMACAIEDAGFEIRDSIHWMYGTGFPKSLSLDGEHEGWGTALKPAHEPVTVARKSLDGTVAANVQRHGTGALNIDGCRVAHSSPADLLMSQKKNAHSRFGSAPPERVAFGRDDRDPTNYDGSAGRWPPNVLLTHTADCGDECVAGCPVRELGEQSGERRSAGIYQKAPAAIGFGGGDARGIGTMYGDSGTAARVFPVFRYEAKASRRERGDGNIHPTVKPIALMRWLARLVTPPSGIILDPFAGSGTTGVAAIREGFRFIGIEREPAYIEIARKRIAEAAAPAQPSLRGVG